MGLQISYTDKKGTTYSQSYWVVSDMKLEKKLHETPDPVIAIVPGSDPAPKWVTTPGYYARLVVYGWKSKSDRDNGEDAYFVHCVYPTDHWTIDSYHEYVNEPNAYRMEYDPTSADSLLTQAYNHLKTLDIFADAVEV